MKNNENKIKFFRPGEECVSCKWKGSESELVVIPNTPRPSNLDIKDNAHACPNCGQILIYGG